MTFPDLAAAAAAAPDDRRTRSRQRRRDQIYAAAVELFIEQGYESATMDEIADRADVARATVFNLFQRKTAFLDEWSSRRRRRALSAVHAEHLEEHSVRQVLERYMIELARVNTESRNETVAIMGAAVHTTNVLGSPPLAHALARLFAAAQEQDRLPRDVDAELAGLVLATGYFATVTAWIACEPPPFDLRQQLLRLLSIILDGILE